MRNPSSVSLTVNTKIIAYGCDKINDLGSKTRCASVAGRKGFDMHKHSQAPPQPLTPGRLIRLRALDNHHFQTAVKLDNLGSRVLTLDLFLRIRQRVTRMELMA